MNTKRILSLFVPVLLGAYMLGAPVERMLRIIPLSNGEEAIVTLCGDESGAYWMTTDGCVAEFTKDGYVLRSLEESNTWQKNRAKKTEKQELMFRSAIKQQNAPLCAMGSPKVAVILANFSDQTFETSLSGVIPTETFQQFFNGNCNDAPERFTALGSWGAVRDYFRDQSRGLFTPDFHVVGQVALNNEKEMYADMEITFLEQVLQQATQLPDIDWTQFDNNGNGKVDAVIVVYAGTGRNTSGNSADLMAFTHCVDMSSSGVTFEAQTACPELRNSGTNLKLNSIGVFCHEISHLLGLPDMYDTEAPLDAAGMDVWDIMDYGEYINAGTCPVNYSAFEKEFMGWITIPTLTENQMLDMQSLPEGGTAYRIYNEAYRDECYIIEVRNKYFTEGSFYNWDYLLCGHSNFVGQGGLLVTHYDFDASRWENNTVNGEKDHPGISIVPANNHFELKNNLVVQDPTLALWKNEYRGHTYPCKNVDAGWGRLGNNMLTDTSEPAATLFHPNNDGIFLLHKCLYNIMQDGADHISLSFTNTSEPEPIESIAADDTPINYYMLDGRSINGRPSGPCLIRARR